MRTGMRRFGTYDDELWKIIKINIYLGWLSLSWWSISLFLGRNLKKYFEVFVQNYAIYVIIVKVKKVEIEVKKSESGAAREERL